MKATNLKLMESTTLKFGLSSCIHKNNELMRNNEMMRNTMKIKCPSQYCFYKSRIKKRNEMKMIMLHINPGIKEAEIIEMSGIKWIEEEAVLFANLSFASDRFLIIRRVASFHLGAENSRQLLTDKFNLYLQYCMIGISAYLC